MQNISYCAALNSEHQAECVGHAIALLAEGEYKLMIIDSLSCKLRQEYQGRGQLAERQFAFSRMLRQLNTAAQEFNVAVVYTNQVMADPGNTMAIVPQVKAVGGNIVSHASTTRIQLKKGRDNNRIVKLIDSPWRPEGDCQLQLTEQGVTDAD